MFLDRVEQLRGGQGSKFYSNIMVYVYICQKKIFFRLFKIKKKVIGPTPYIITYLYGMSGYVTLKTLKISNGQQPHNIFKNFHYILYILYCFYFGFSVFWNYCISFRNNITHYLFIFLLNEKCLRVCKQSCIPEGVILYFHRVNILTIHSIDQISTDSIEVISDLSNSKCAHKIQTINCYMDC